MNAKQRVTDLIESTLKDLGRDAQVMWEFGTPEFGWVVAHFWVAMTMEQDGYILHGSQNEVRITSPDLRPVENPWFMIASRPAVKWVDSKTGVLSAAEVRTLVTEAVAAIDAQIAARRETLAETVRRDRERSIRVD